MNQLAQFLMSQRPGTIGNPAQSSPAQYQVDILKAQRDQELADQMMHAGYVQNSGGLGVLASALSSLVGAKMSQGANDSLSTALQAKFDDDNKQALAKRERDLADEDRKYQRDIDKAQKEAEAKAKIEAANRPPMSISPGSTVFDPVSGKQLFSAPEKADKPTEEARNFQMYQRMSPDQRAQWDQMHGRSSLGTPGSGEVALTGDDFLKTLDPGTGNLIKAIAEGRQAMPNGRSAQGIKIAQMVQQYDPQADAITLKQRMDTAHDFSPAGKSGASVKAIDQLSSHLEALDESMKGLNNTRFPVVNAAENWMAEATGSGKPTAFNLNAKAVADELTKAWRGSAGAEADIKSWKESLTPNMSPDQQKAAMQKLVELVNGADQALQDSYARGMRLNDQPQSFITPKTRAILDRLGGKPAAATAAQQQGGTTPVYEANGWKVEVVH